MCQAVVNICSKAVLTLSSHVRQGVGILAGFNRLYNCNREKTIDREGKDGLLRTVVLFM